MTELAFKIIASRGEPRSDPVKRYRTVKDALCARDR